MKWVFKDAEKGDIVRVKLGAIYHYGIYVSDERIIQFGLPPTLERVAADVAVLSSDIDAFLSGGFLEVGVPEGAEKRAARSPEKTVSTAESRIGETGYDLFRNNCEHFAYECKLGKKYSSQSEAVAAEIMNSPVLDVYVQKFPFDVESEVITPEQRSLEIQRCTDPDVKNSKFYVWKLLGQALKKSFGYDIEKLELKCKNGKWSCRECYFSLSHSGDVAAVAVSRKPVGMDIEAVNPKRFTLGLQDRILAPKEKKAIENLSEPARAAAANALWTKKEALFKLGTNKTFIPHKVDTTKTAVKTQTLNVGETEYILSVAASDISRVAIITEKH